MAIKWGFHTKIYADFQKKNFPLLVRLFRNSVRCGLRINGFGLVENKDVSINVCIKFTYNCLDNCHVLKFHLSSPYVKFSSFTHRKMWININVKIFFLCFAWDSYLQQKIQDCMLTSCHVRVSEPVGLNGWVFFYKLSGCGFESRFCHLKHPRFNKCQNVRLLLQISSAVL